MIWYFENLPRYRQEREALESLAASAHWVIPGEWRIDSSLRVIWDAEIVVSDRSFPISLRYPNHFPHSPPLVLPRGDAERWSSHQYGAGGELCLEWGPDNWHPDVTGADMIESAHRLLAGERTSPEDRGQVASRHATTLGQDLRGDRRRLLVTRGVAAVIDTIDEGEVRQGIAIGMLRDFSIVYVVTSLTTSSGENWIDETVPRTLIDDSQELPLVVVRWPADAELPSTKSRTEFFSSAFDRDIEFPDVRYVVLAQKQNLRGYFLWKDDDSVTLIPVIPPQEAAARVDTGHQALKERKVAIVGCGSLGSKVAVMLARSWVGHFLLVDDDVMLPDNVVRHDLDWRQMGMHKVDGTAHRIALVNPQAQCETRQYRLGGQHSSGSVESLIGMLATCDLLIDASADARVFNYLCAAASVGKKPMIWTEVYGGGIGGLISRHRPGLEPDPATMRAAIEQWCASQGKSVERSAIDYETRTSGPPLIADDADVTVIAAHAARLAIDTLIPRDPSIFPNSVYMIGMAGGWIFDQPFETHPIDVGLTTPHLSEAMDEQMATAERARIIQLFTNFSDANPSDSPDN